MRYIHYAPTHVLYNGGDAGHGVVGSSKLRRAQKLTVLVRGFACESTQSVARACESSRSAARFACESTRSAAPISAQ